MIPTLEKMLGVVDVSPKRMKRKEGGGEKRGVKDWKIDKGLRGSLEKSSEGLFIATTSSKVKEGNCELRADEPWAEKERVEVS